MRSLLRQFPAVALLGPRQCGKSTLASHLLSEGPPGKYLDLERPSDLQRLGDVELFFRMAGESLVCLDDAQLLPQLFPELRGVLDRGGRPGQLLLLGSASQELVNRSAVSLAGRIAYVELGGLSVAELERSGRGSYVHVWVRGGFPASLLLDRGMQNFTAESDAASFVWREQFIRTFLDRDLPQLGLRTAAPVIRRFWQMCAHNHAQLLNRSKLEESLGVDQKSIERYLRILEQTIVLRLLPPYHANNKKRLVKSPKVYVRDAGLLHCLLGITSFDDLLGHIALGASWEGFVIEELLRALPPGWQGSFSRSSNGNEIGLILERGSRRLAVRCKVSTPPKLTRGFYAAFSELEIEHAWVICPLDDSFPLSAQVTVAGIAEAVAQIQANMA